MKIKNYTRYLVLPLLALAMVFAFNQCKNVGQTDWPDPDVAVLNQLKINVINTNDGLSLEGYDIKVVLPNGTTKEFNGNTGTFTFDGTTEGTYVITASKEGYLAESTVINVSNDQTEAVSTVTQHVFFLNKKGSTNVVSQQGTVLYVESDQSTPTTITFPAGSLPSDQNITVTYIAPLAQFEELNILGERAILYGYNFSPDFTFPDNARPTITIPINIPSVTDGETDLWIGTYNENTNTWEAYLGTLNAERTTATFEMPHFSTWFVFTGYKLIKDVEIWSPWSFVAESEKCGDGVCGTFIYAVTPNALVNRLLSVGYNFNLKVKDTRCIGPHAKYIQQLFARAQLITYKVYDYQGVYLGAIQVPTKKVQWMADEFYCHDQGDI